MDHNKKNPAADGFLYAEEEGAGNLPGLHGRIGKAEIRAAAERLERYRLGKQRLDARLYDEALWWQNRHGDISREGSTRAGSRPVSAWLFSAVASKHADLCDRYPACTVLPREPDDEADAALLSEVLPVIAERCRFEQTYSDNAWVKLKHGMSAYGVFWNPRLENGAGDIDIRRIDVLNLYWEPGVRDIQDSPHLYLVGLEDTAALRARYPFLAAEEDAGRYGEAGLSAGALSGGSFLLRDRAGAPDQTAVVDWYYKITDAAGRTVLHYAKFVGTTLLYASENDPLYAERGWYEHGAYPIVTDVFYPEADSPAGYGLIAVGRNPQGYIDELDGHILEYANTASRVRYWAKRSLGINEKDFLDPEKRIIPVEGDIDEEKLRQITLSPLDGMLAEIRSMKINELKETTGVRDINQGGTSGGVTAASAITALQEAGDKGSRDCVSGSYRAYVGIMRQVIELIRQFYDAPRCFRVIGETGERRYVRLSGRSLAERQTGRDAAGNPLFRCPVFDIDVRAEHQTPLDRTGRNELMIRLFLAGALDPDRETAACRMLSGMDFDGIGKLRAGLMRAERAPTGTVSGGEVRA